MNKKLRKPNGSHEWDGEKGASFASQAALSHRRVEEPTPQLITPEQARLQKLEEAMLERARIIWLTQQHEELVMRERRMMA
jgi:hypothetical protein